MDLELYIHTLIRKGIVPGISILSAAGDTVRFKAHYGFKSLLPRKELLHEDTLYDVASLTKPLITALLTLYLVDKKVLAPDTLVREVFPHLNEFGDMNLLHLLTHTSGLPAWYPLYLFGSDYLGQFPAIPLKCKPGKQVVYSCPGYILLYYIIQKTAGASFKDLAREVVFEPLALKNTFLQVPERMKQHAAPTERGNTYERKIAGKWAASCESGKYLQLYRHFRWRKEIIRGETHDLYSFNLGESAGNTGLFSTTGDLFRLTLEFYPDTATLLSIRTLQFCWTNFTPFKRSHRSAGFKLNSSFITSGGRAFSRKAIGHNGFTGTSLWLDHHHKSKQDTTVILLTNAIHPEVKGINLNRVRRKLHRLLVR